MKPNRVSCNLKSKWEKGRILQAPSLRVQPILSCRAGQSKVARWRCAVCLRPQPGATGHHPLDPGRMSPKNGQAQIPGLKQTRWTVCAALSNQAASISKTQSPSGPTWEMNDGTAPFLVVHRHQIRGFFGLPLAWETERHFEKRKTLAGG